MKRQRERKAELVLKMRRALLSCGGTSIYIFYSGSGNYHAPLPAVCLCCIGSTFSVLSIDHIRFIVKLQTGAMMNEIDIEEIRSDL